jgi:hypothetical protein
MRGRVTDGPLFRASLGWGRRFGLGRTFGWGRGEGRRRPVRERRGRAGQAHEQEGDDLPRAERLVEHHEPRDGGGAGLDAHQHPEHARRDPPQGDHLEPVGDRRREQGDAEPDQQQRRPVDDGPGPVRAERQHHERGDAERAGEAVEPGQHAPDPRRRHDVARPAHAGDERERQAAQGHVARRVEAEQRDAGRGEERPRAVEPAAGLGERQQQRPAELDGDGDAERDGPQREVEDEVHRRHAHAEQRRGLPRLAVPAPEAGSQHDEEQQRGEPEAQGGDARRAEVVERGAGERAAALHRRDRAQHEQRVGPPHRRPAVGDDRHG